MTKETDTPNGATVSAPTAASSPTPPLAVPQTNPTPESVHGAASERKARDWTLSDEGIRFIATLESGVINGSYKGMPVTDGMILQVYNDSKGNPTVGLGHLVVPSDHLTVGETISVQRARDLAKHDLSVSESALNRRIRVPLKQNEYDALVSIAFNAGSGTGIARLVDRVNEGDYAALPNYIQSYRSRGIEWRRGLESRLFEAGNYDGQHQSSHKPTHSHAHTRGHRGNH